MKGVSRCDVRVLGIAILAFLIASPAFAQQGQINGVVSDSSGGVIPGATVTATETATGFVQTTVSGANGRYSFPSLRPAGYTISAELTGFRTFRREGVVLEANQSLTVSIQLELGELSETVTVAGEASQVDITTATIAEVVDHARIVELPIAGREVARLQTLVPGRWLVKSAPRPASRCRAPSRFRPMAPATNRTRTGSTA